MAVPHRFSLIIAVLLAFLQPLRLAAQTDSALTARVDRLFVDWDKPDSPGLSVAVSRNGEVVYERALGMANLELNVPITPESVFELASVSKQFTAMSILLLAQQGQLSVDDEVRKYLTEFPDYGTKLTIRHLLTHTSGLRDVYLLRDMIAPIDENRDRVARDDMLIALLARQRELNFTPGSEFQYNNGGYAVLAAIVRRVSGQSLAAFERENIFEPLGMASTRVNEDPAVLMPHLVTGYDRGADGWRAVRRGDRQSVLGSSGMLSNTRDLLLWENNFADPRVGGPALIAEMQTAGRLTSGEPIPYGFGLWIESHNGLKTIDHAGGNPGISTYVARYPEQGLAVVMLSNTAGGHTSELAKKVAEVFLEGSFPDAVGTGTAAAAEELTLNEEQLQAMTGLYGDPAAGAYVNVFIQDGGLRGALGSDTNDSFGLIPTTENRFVIPGTTYAVEFGEVQAGRPTEMRSFAGPNETGRLTRIASRPALTVDMRDYVGEYANTDLGVTWSITAGDSGLSITVPGRPAVDWETVVDDTFLATGNFIRFTRDDRNAVIGFTFESPGARHLLFERESSVSR